MVKIIQKNWENLNIRTLAEITTETRRNEGLGDYTIDQVEEHLTSINERFPIEMVFLAIDGDKTLGWIGIERVTENIGEVGRWQPFVKSHENKEAIAQQLISSINRYAKSSDLTRIEIAFGGVSEQNIETYKTRCSWYETQGWSKLEDTNFMVRNLKQGKLESIQIPSDFSLRPLLEFDNETIFQCYYDAFTTGRARWIHEMTREQIRQEFEKNFDRTHDIDNEASFVILSDGIIVGFNLVLTRSDEEEHLEAIGIHPKFRGKGLGKILLSKSIEVLQNQRAQNMSLGVDIVNIPAVKLYEQFGFDTVSRTARYFWKSFNLKED
jgi:GNAT superfamily N-acetyltransferase